MILKNDYNYWINIWQKSKNFRVENDRIKPKSYLFSSFPKINYFGFQDGNLRPIIVGDFFSRLQRMQGYNVFFPTGFDSLGFSSYLENKKHSNINNDDIEMVFEEQMLKLGIGIDMQNLINLKHDEYLSILQLAFIELYEKGYVKYDFIDVLEDKKNKKIFDLWYKNDTYTLNKLKTFYLDISNIKQDIVENIKELNTSKQIQEKLLSYLVPQKKIKLEISTSINTVFEIELVEPQYMGAIAFILINPDYIDIAPYCSPQNFFEIEKYLSSDTTNCIGIRSDIWAINPLTGDKIPIFISVKYDMPVYVGNPYLNMNDYNDAKEEWLVIRNVVQNGVFIQSDFLNGVKEEEGKELLIKTFYSADICSVNEYYSKDKILISSLDSFGALVPFLKDNEDNIYDLKRYIPFNFSSKFRPVLSDDVDVEGSIINFTINHLFSTGLLPILTMLYDNIGSNISIFSTEANKIFNMWNGINLMTISEDELLLNVFIPTVIFSIIKKETNLNTPPLFREIRLVKPTFDENYLKFSRSNNLFNISRFLDEYKGDAFRLYFLSKKIDSDFIFSEEELSSVKNLLIGIREKYENLVEKNDLEAKFAELITIVNDAVNNHDINSYVAEVFNFYKHKIGTKFLSYKQGLIFLKILYPICPFISEDIYKEIYKGKYLISDDGWI